MPYATRRLYKKLVQVYIDAKKSTFTSAEMNQMKDIVEKLGGILVEKCGKATHIITTRPMHFIVKCCRGCSNLDTYRNNVREAYKVFILKSSWLKTSGKKGLFVDEMKYLHKSDENIGKEPKGRLTSQNTSLDKTTSEPTLPKSNQNSKESAKNNTVASVEHSSVQHSTATFFSRSNTATIQNTPEIPSIRNLDQTTCSTVQPSTVDNSFSFLTPEGIFNFGYLDNTNIPTKVAWDLLSEIFS